MIYVKEYESPLGYITLAAEGEAVTGAWFKGQMYYMNNIREYTLLSGSDGNEPLEKAILWLDRYFRGEAPKVTEMKLAPAGTDFQKRVWQGLINIEYGEKITYKELALEVFGKERRLSYQAVGSAVGHNPIAIIIPCHRVIGSDGGLHGYAGGLDRKEWLLKHEEKPDSRGIYIANSVI